MPDPHPRKPQYPPSTKKTRNQDRAIINVGDHAALNTDEKKNHLQTSRYARAARMILEDMRTPPEWKRPATGYFQAINTRRMNMRRWAILDSGASSHFLIVDAPLLHKRKTANPIVVTVANGERVQSTHDGALDIPGLPPGTRYAHVIPGIKHSLLSIVRLCNAGYKIVFGRWGLNIEVRYKGKAVMKDRKGMINGLWYVPITKITSEDNPEQTDKSEINLNQQGQETATQATQRQVRFQTTNAQELDTSTHQESVRINHK